MARARRGRGEGGIHQRQSDRRWMAYVTWRDSSGKRRRKVRYAKDKAQALKLLEGLQRERGRPSSSPLSVEQYLEQWLQAIAPKISRTTAQRYGEAVRHHINPHLGTIPLRDLNPGHIDQWYTALLAEGKPPTACRRSGGVFAGALQYAVFPLELIPHNPARGVRKPKVPKQERPVLDPDQVVTFLAEAFRDRLYALYVLAMVTSLRQGELLGLKWSDIHWEERCLVVQRALKELSGELWLEEAKTARAHRRIDLPPMAFSALQEHWARMLAERNYRHAGYIFLGKRGRWLHKNHVTQDSFRGILQRAGLPRICFHDLRHTGATLLLMLGEQPLVVAQRLGHGNTNMVMSIYGHVLPTMQRAAADKLEGLLADRLAQVTQGLSYVAVKPGPKPRKADLGHRAIDRRGEFIDDRETRTLGQEPSHADAELLAGASSGVISPQWVTPWLSAG